LEGDVDLIQHLELVDQHAIGKSMRSNPVTYIKAYDPIRQLFAAQPLARKQGYHAGYFSFNTPGGRCETCQGEGKVVIEMQFMASVALTCESCQGKRFKDDVLEIAYKQANIADVLSMTIDDAAYFFRAETSIYKKLTCLQEAGLGYITLGQPTSLLSGGEAQRLKLATYLLNRAQQQQHTLFILDEPTTGLHVHDIRKLLSTLQSLVKAGHTIVAIEHTMEFVKCADWIIDLGPEGGDNGGRVVCSGSPEAIMNCPDSHTARYLKEKLVQPA
jgi:excinuclease ABC subunit A